jgi:hypothetical protein
MTEDALDIFNRLQRAGNSALGTGGGNSGGQDFQDIVNLVISTILNPLILLFLGLAVVYFMWGVFKYVGKGESESDRREGAQMMMYGIVAIFVMVSVWGLVTILINTFGLDPSVPNVPALK